MSADAPDVLDAVALSLDEAAERLAELTRGDGDGAWFSQRSVMLARDRLLTARNELIDEAGRLRAHDVEAGR